MPRTKNARKPGHAARRSAPPPPSRRSRSPSTFACSSPIPHDLWWTWHEQAASLFRSLDPVRWEATSHNPVAMLRQTPSEVLHVRVAEPPMRKAIESVHREMLRYRAAKTWFDRHRRRKAPSLKVAYLCSEYAIHESMPQYSGGLGVLAGDHIKNARAISASPSSRSGCSTSTAITGSSCAKTARRGCSIRARTRRFFRSRTPACAFQCPIGTRMPHVRVWRQRVGRELAAARHRSCRERSGRSAADRGPLQGRTAAAHGAAGAARRRRHDGARGTRRAADGGASQRGPCGLRGRVDARERDASGRIGRGGDRVGQAIARLHDAHARARGPRPVCGRDGREGPRAGPSVRRAAAARFLRRSAASIPSRRRSRSA